MELFKYQTPQLCSRRVCVSSESGGGGESSRLRRSAGRRSFVCRCVPGDRKPGESSTNDSWSCCICCPQVTHTHTHPHTISLFSFLLYVPVCVGQVQRYLGEVEKQAAVIIQKVWRGHKERRRFKQVRHTLSQYRAAVVLQRAVITHTYTHIHTHALSCVNKTQTNVLSCGFRLYVF